MSRVVRYVRPDITPYQERAFFHDKRYGLVFASTKAGKTVGALIWIIEQAVLGPGKGANYWWVAPIRPVAKIAFRRAKRAIMDGGIQIEVNETEMTITLPNGAVIWFKSAHDPDSLYGEDVYAAVIDEMTRMAEPSWVAVRSTLTATRGPIRMVGNQRGVLNWAYKLAVKAQAEGNEAWVIERITAWEAVEAGILDREEIEDAQRTLPTDVFEELYLAQPSKRTRFFSSTPTIMPASAVPEGAKMVRAWDFAVTPPAPGKDPDFSAGVKIAMHGGRTYVLDVILVRLSPDQILDLFARTAATDMCDQVVEEERGAAGKMLLASLQSLIAERRIPVQVRPAPLTGDKSARAYMVAARWNDGDVVLVEADWNGDLLAQTDLFPSGGGHDDAVDALAHAFNDLDGRSYMPITVTAPGDAWESPQEDDVTDFKPNFGITVNVP